MSSFTLGIDVGGSKIAYGVFHKHHLLRRLEHPTRAERSSAEILHEIKTVVHNIVAQESEEGRSLAGIGMAFPSYIDYERGHILFTSAITSLRDIPVRRIFEMEFACPVRLDNDCNVAALAELRKGAGRGLRNFLYCAVSTGIANGIIIDGKVFRGSYGAAGETGHMLITPEQGLRCGCGNQGCFMSYASGGMIVKHICERLKAGEKSLMTELCHGDLQQISGPVLHKAALQGDKLALSAVDQMSKYLGIWLYNIYACFNINCFIFGGGLVHFGELLFRPVRETFDRYNQSFRNYPVEFKFAELKQDFGIIGAELLLQET